MIKEREGNKQREEKKKKETQLRRHAVGWRQNVR